MKLAAQLAHFPSSIGARAIVLNDSLGLGSLHRALSLGYLRRPIPLWDGVCAGSLGGDELGVAGVDASTTLEGRQISISERFDGRGQFFPAPLGAQQPSGKEKRQFSDDARFFNEARAANLIAHPGIVKVFDYGHEPGGVAYLAMELLDGESLWKRIERTGKMAKDDTLRLARQIASALSAAHEKGIVHRDLKPDNVFVVPDVETPGGERIKLLDFGIAKMAEGGRVGVKTQANVIMGTPAYMSPEQCLGAKDVDAKTDVYALGIILFEMLAGQTPFVAEQPGALLALHMLKPPPLLTQFVPLLPSKLVGLVHSMLAKEPTARPTMEQVTAQLQRLFQGGRDTPSLQLPLVTVEGEERATVQAKALGGRRKSTEISGSDLAVTTALRGKKLAAAVSQPAGSKATASGEAGAFDPTSPGDPDFVSKLDGLAAPDNASTIPVQSMRLSDIHPAVREKQRAAAELAARPGPAAPAPRSGPGAQSGAAWVPMEIVSTDYKSTPQVPETADPKRPTGPPAAVSTSRQLMLGMILFLALLLIAMIGFLLWRKSGG